MKKSVAYGVLLALLPTTTAHSAVLIDITANDGQSNPTSWGQDPRAGIGESKEVARDCQWGDIWDNKGVGQNQARTTITIISGFNLSAGEGGFGLGDIFLNVGGQIPTSTRPSTSDGYLTYPNPGFNAVVHMTAVVGDRISYQVALIDDKFDLQSTYYNQNNGPWRLADVPGGLQTATLTTTVVTMTDSQVINDLGINIGYSGTSDPNYVATFDVSQLVSVFGSGASFSGTFDFGCGNDPIWTYGKLGDGITPIPETGSCALGIVGLMILIYQRRRIPS